MESSELHNFLKLSTSKGSKYHICPDTGIIDIDGDLDFTKYRTIIIPDFVGGKLPVKFGKVTGRFNCCGLELKTLENSPYYVGGGASIFSYNNLESIDWEPEYIGEIWMQEYMPYTERYVDLYPELENIVKVCKCVTGIDILNELKIMYEAKIEKRMIELL